MLVDVLGNSLNNGDCVLISGYGSLHQGVVLSSSNRNSSYIEVCYIDGINRHRVELGKAVKISSFNGVRNNITDDVVRIDAVIKVDLNNVCEEDRRKYEKFSKYLKQIS